MIFVFCMPVYAETSNTAREFLTWRKEQQDSFIQSSLLMAVTIAAQFDQKFGDCIVDWYTNDPNIVEKRNFEILEMMEKHQEFRPSSVLLAVVQKQCGRFTDY